MKNAWTKREMEILRNYYPTIISSPTSRVGERTKTRKAKLNENLDYD